MSVNVPINATFGANILTMKATIYTRTPGTGPGTGGFGVVARADLACSLDPAMRQPGATNATRAELANLATFAWDATYDMAEQGIQIEVDAYPGRRWTPVVGTYWPDIVPGVGIIGRSCDVRRSTSGAS